MLPLLSLGAITEDGPSAFHKNIGVKSLGGGGNVIGGTGAGHHF